MPTIFTRIINREIPCYLVAEDENFIAFLDINPLAEGHTLVVTKQEIDYVFDQSDQTLQALMLFCKKVSAQLVQAIPCLRVGLAVIGLEVPHTHVHLIPMNSMNDVNFSKPKLKFSSEQFATIAQKIREKA
jgi:histidine triad (HIT) family protein